MNIQLTLQELNDRANSIIKRNLNMILVGFPGIGKSQWIESLAKSNSMNYIPYVPSMGNPSEIKGLPFNNNGKAEFLFYEFMQSIMECKGPTIVHIEDLIQATPLMQAALMSLIHKREVNGKSIPEHITVILDTNDASHRSGGNMVLSPMLNRASIFEFPIDVKGWINWAMTEGKGRIAREVILFIHAFPEYFCSKSIPRGIEAFNTPRSWERVSGWISDGFTDAVTLASDIGFEIAIKLSAFITDIEKFGSILAKVKSDPDTAPLYESENDVYGVLLILSNHFEKGNVSNLIRYFKRYGNDELLRVLFEVGTMVHPDSKETKEYVNFISG